MIEEFDDDTHYCIKCSTMIIGLDNYVTHRKSNCGKTIHHDEDIPKSPLPSQLLTPEDSFGLKADDFFSSLELQSSSKKLPSSTTGKSLSGVLTRSKTSSVMHSTPKDSDIQHSKSGKNAWIGGHQLKEISGDDNHSKLIRAVDNLSRNTSLKKDIITPYEITDDESDDYYYDDDSESDVDDLLDTRHHPGGKWKPSSSPVEWQNRSWSSPPANFTGGKWKPGSKRSSSPPPTHTKGKWKPTSPNPVLKDAETPRASYTGGKWKSKLESREQEWDIVEFNVPPPKGKLKPSSDDSKNSVSEPVEKKIKLYDDKKNIEKDKTKIVEIAPPPTHTKGKWKPTKTIGDKDKIKNSFLRKSSGRVQYWCGSCNRRLASKIVYERHLKSELHLKRSQQEFDDLSHLNTTAKELRPTEQERDLRKDHWSHTGELGDNRDGTKIAKRTRRRTFLKCGVCRSRVHTQMMGKHLISHYHCRKGDITLPAAREMVLENIHSIVLQSPYQCATCSFYCNTQVDFLRHWCSLEHEASACKFPGTFSCAFCKFQTPDNKRMLEHLLSAEHKEVISVINRSVPIVIKKLNYVACQTCDVKFLLNIQLRKHCEREKHPYANTASDAYQNRNNCDKCDHVFKSKVALQRHKKRVHQDSFNFCSVCNLTFSNIFDAKRHRSSTQHRIALQSSKRNSSTGKDPKKKCIYCEDILDNIIELRNHLSEKHPEHNYSCSMCGKSFVIAQDLTVHLRNKSCSYSYQDKNTKTCDVCLFSTTSESELIFHKVLHTKPIIVEDTKKGSVEKYKCPLCEKISSKGSLRCHIRLHTKERPFTCKTCLVSFVRKSNWLHHTKKCGIEKDTVTKLRKKKDDSTIFLCSTCGMSFKRRSVLYMHMVRHTGRPLKCEEKDCVFAARSAGELKEHQRIHSTSKPFKCDSCDYSGKTKKQLMRHQTIHTDEKKYKCSTCSFTTRVLSHLKRHARLHTGSKPYACPHCKYRCNNLENLRKHVLSTNKHPGKYIYECKFCSANNFQGNFAKEFRVHLVTAHPDVFKTGTEAVSYVTGIYKGGEDITTTEDKSVNVKPDNYATPIIAIAGTSMLTTSSSKIETKVQDNYFPLYASTNDLICVDNQTDTWSFVEKYEETGTLVTFKSDGESLFEEI
nr:zinc finger protein 62 [Onthophagus taurus]